MLLRGAYLASQALTGAQLRISGEGPVALNNTTLSAVGQLTLGAKLTASNLIAADALIVATVPANISGTLSLIRAAMSNAGATTVATCQRLIAIDSYLQVRGQVTAVSSIISGCVYTTTSIYRTEHEAARVNLRGLHLPEIVSATVLGTDADGQVIAKTSLTALTITTATITTANVTVLDAADAALGKLYLKSETVSNGGTLSTTKSRAVIDNSSVAASVTLPATAGNDQTFELVGRTNARGFTVNVPAGNTFAGIGGTAFAVSASTGAGLPRAVVFRQFTEWFISTGGL
jgi:hypothetical protein